MWEEQKRRRVQAINEESMGVAILSSVVSNCFSAFGGKGKPKPVTPEMFLPYQLDDPDSPKNKYKEQISKRTALILTRMMEEGRLPPAIQKQVIADKDFYQAVKERADG